MWFECRLYRNDLFQTWVLPGALFGVGGLLFGNQIWRKGGPGTGLRLKMKENQKISENIFNELYNEVISYYNSSNSKIYLFDGFAGADTEYSLRVRFLVKKAWQAHFVHNMFIKICFN